MKAYAGTNYSTLVVNRSGGVGKTLLTQALRALMTPPAGGNLRTFSIDTFEDGQQSKLSRVMSYCVDIPIAPKLSTTKSTAIAWRRLWDKVFLNIAEGNALIDFGANVIPLFAQWLELQNGDDYGVVCAPVLLVVPITNSAQALSDGRATIEGFWKTRKVLPVGLTVVWLNEVFGPIGKSSSPDYDWLISQAREGRLTILRMPKWEGDFAQALDARNMGLMTAYNMSDAKLYSNFGFRDQRLLLMAKVRMRDWLIAIGYELRKAGIVVDEENESA